MLKKKTTFVLGAGASVPFGFPTGLKLSEEIVKGLDPYGPVAEALQKYGSFSKDEIDRFKTAFFYSGKNSVDAFLEHRSEFTKIGKAAIASVLIGYEIPENLFRYNDNWLRYLYDKMNTSFEEFSDNKLSIITFNYDRTVEEFFYTSLKNTYSGLLDNQYIFALSRVPVIHLHGRLGHLKYQGPRSRSFSPRLDEETVALATENIEIIHEVTREFTRAKKHLIEAEQIFFLGFGYNEKNLERLDVKNIPPGIAFGTRLGMTDHEWENVNRLTAGKVSPINGDCMDCLRNCVEWG